MTKIARYVVIIDREIGEQDGQEDGYHDGTGTDAVRQLSAEIQEAIDESGAPYCSYKIVQRVVLNATPRYPNIPERFTVFSEFEDDPAEVPA